MRDLHQLIAALVAAHGTDDRISPAMPHLSRAEILEVQSGVAARLGPVAGFKVGRVADGPPIMAPLPACYTVENDGVRWITRPFGVELEIGFRLIKALPAPELPAQPERYFTPCVVLELVDTRLSEEAATRADLKFADLQINGGLVCGPRVDGWDGTDFAEVDITLWTGTGDVVTGKAQVPGGSALSNLDLLISHIGTHCGGLEVGQTVITGSLCGLPYFDPGTVVSGQIAGLGQVSVRLARRQVPASGMAAGSVRSDP